MNYTILAVSLLSGSLIIFSGFTSIWFTIFQKTSQGNPTTTPAPVFNLSSYLNETSKCGLRDLSKGNIKIMNGVNSIKNSWPWIVSLRIYYRFSKTFSSHLCAGTLIDAQTVLTAAHCVIDQTPNDLAIVVGINSIKELLNSQNVHFVSKIIHHKNYNNTVISNDIALVRLSKPINSSSKVSIVCLPGFSLSGNYVLNKDLTLIGWGSVDGQKTPTSLSADLQETKLRIINGNSLCSRYVKYDVSKIYCAIDPKSSSNSNACFGDSGGPLLYQIEKNWYIFGITSFVLSNTKGECNPSVPSYYTQVPAYIDWIIENLKLLQP